MARIDIVSAPFGTELAFLGPPALAVHALPLLHPDELVKFDPATASLSIAIPAAPSQPTAEQQPEPVSYSMATVDVVSNGGLRTQAQAADLDKQWEQHIQQQSGAANAEAGRRYQNADEEDAANAEAERRYQNADEEDAVLFAEESVRARGGLQMREKVWFGTTCTLVCSIMNTCVCACCHCRKDPESSAAQLCLSRG